MHKILITISLVFCFLGCGSSAITREPFPRLLPPPKDFRLTLREEPHSKMPFDPSCGGEASLTLLCRAITLTLEMQASRRSTSASCTASRGCSHSASQPGRICEEVAVNGGGS